MKRTALVALAAVLLTGVPPVLELIPRKAFAQTPGQTSALASPEAASAETDAPEPRIFDDVWLPAPARERLELDRTAMRIFRPGYSFWQHVFLIPDGSVAFGSARDGRLLAVFPARGDWRTQARWEDRALAGSLQGSRLVQGQSQRRDQVADLLEARAGPVVHNATRGNFLAPNARRYGGFLEEWGRIYERFGVPAEIGLAQAIVESGLNGRIRSEQRALGFCQWLPANWEKMKRLAPHVIEGYNQTTQAPYCAAYLTILATRYGSFIPALSEHHAGGTNVGRTLINGERLGGTDIREKYFLGSELARDLRRIAPRRFTHVVRTYGPRSYLYAEMVFGNGHTVEQIRESAPQVRIHAMRAPRAIPLAEITRATGLSADEVRRFNPALVRQVPRNANLYLPFHVEAFGPDAAFWHHPVDPGFRDVLEDFLRMDAAPEDWERSDFRRVLERYRARFLDTGTEEGAVMATALAYVAEEMYRSRRAAILAEYRSDARVLQLFHEGVRERERAGALAADR